MLHLLQLDPSFDPELVDGTQYHGLRCIDPVMKVTQGERRTRLLARCEQGDDFARYILRSGVLSGASRCAAQSRTRALE
ncbi:hypothetical protein [Parerythrobacter lacustris]|uniref:Uncharacterized protein n=1 Tax=Parerythrobacter lacustris TaxID=2969984 RepID=A0ABT1XU31_9SPHN|nr:hypothetical protein [Parerythrobacter lacustris]MCR2833927.1 hypothetical protein [Parerythrobacter lacustris]